MVDVWSKKGIVLLNISPTAHGDITKEQQDILKTIGKWIKKHEEAVYLTRVNSVFGYGKAEFEKGEFGGQAATMEFTKDDVRFTRSKNGKTLFVYTLGLPKANTEIEIIHVFDSMEDKKVKEVKLVGNDMDLKWKVSDNKLIITTPDSSKMDELTTVFKVEFK